MPDRSRGVAFGAAGLVATAAALGPPLHGAAETSLAAHMSQHVLLTSVAAPLLAAAAAAIPVFASFSVQDTEKDAKTDRRWVGVLAGLTALHVVVVLGWHLPSFYEAATDYVALHAIMHGTFLVTAVAFWWAVLGAGRRERYGAGVLALFLGTLAGTALGAAMTVADRPWYASYRDLDDQQLAGVVMWAGGGTVALVAAVLVFAAWLANAERQTPGRMASGPALLVVAVLAITVLGACQDESNLPSPVPGGSVEAGATAIDRYGCGACHTIPGIDRADAVVGPPLTRWSRRVFIAGQLPNTQDNLMRWIRDPEGVEPGTAMPDLGVTEDDARDIAAYLLSID